MSMTADEHRDYLLGIFALGRSYEHHNGDIEKQKEIFKEVEKTIDFIASEFDW